MENYTLFRTFKKETEVQDLIEAINKLGIDYKIQKVSINLIPYLVFNTQEQSGIFIKLTDLPKLEKMLKEQYKEYHIEEHPLNDLNNDELLDILKKQDEWSMEDSIVARRILNERGKHISDKQISEFKHHRMKELKKPKSGDKYYIALGFLLPVIALVLTFYIDVILAFITDPLTFTVSLIFMIFYFFSYGIGINYYFDYKKLPNGEKVKAYDEKTRKTGVYIIAWSLAITILYILAVTKIF